jgi:hypothetical protein
VGGVTINQKEEGTTKAMAERSITVEANMASGRRWRGWQH